MARLTNAVSRLSILKHRGINVSVQIYIRVHFECEINKTHRGCRRSRVVTFMAIRLRGSGFKPRPEQKFENENFCFRRTPAVVKACHPCRVRPIKTPLYEYLSYL